MCGLVNKGVNIMNCINFQWDIPNMGCRVSTFSLETIVGPPTSLLIQVVTGGLFSGFIELHPNKFMDCTINTMNCIHFQWDMANMGCSLSTFADDC